MFRPTVLHWSGLFIALLLVAVACGGGSGDANTDDSLTAASQEDGAAVSVEEQADEASSDTVAAVSASSPDTSAQAQAAPDTSAQAQAAPEPAAATGRTGDEKLAPELTKITGWINSEPFTLQEQRGNVVLVDFWTYTCINCIRTFPYLKQWHDKYADQGLVIVGVHAPEFEFEKDYDNVVEASLKYGLKYPIAQDNDFGTWRAYDNHFWPAKYLIDRDGYIRYTHFGEGSYAETEETIRDLLMERGGSVSQIAPNLDPDSKVDPLSFIGDPLEGLTRELYAGYQRNYAAMGSMENPPPYVMNREYYDGGNQARMYTDPGDRINHFMYLQGFWHLGPESLTHARMTEELEDYLALLFFATELNVVMSPEAGEPYEVRVTVDGLDLDDSTAGDDIRLGEEGDSYVLVDEARLYNLVKLPEFGGHELKLSSNSDNFSVFAFTFGAYVNEPQN